MSDEKQFVKLSEIAGVRFKCGCGADIPVRFKDLDPDKIRTLIANHIHDVTSYSDVTQDTTFLSGTLSKFFCEDLKRIAQIADRRKLEFSFEIRDAGRPDEG